jgi:hypothetical protein
MKALILCLALSGCATCREHPMICAAGAALATGTAIALVNAQSDARMHSSRNTQPVLCQGGNCQ